MILQKQVINFIIMTVKNIYNVNWMQIKKGIKEHNSDGENENKKENIAGLSEHMKETGYNPSLEYINIIRY